jgi:hypothetical protein
MRRFLTSATLFVSLAFASHAFATTYSGEAVVRSIDPTRVAVFLDSDGDHLVDNGFLLTTDIPMHGNISVHLPAAQLVFTDGYVRVSCEKSVYDLQVAGYPDPPAAPTDSKVVTLIGSALTHSSGDSGCDIQRARDKDAGACFAYGRE